MPLIKYLDKGVQYRPMRLTSSEERMVNAMEENPNRENITEVGKNYSTENATVITKKL